jgi:peptidoglycan/xylan/chitin deacetylase (PgdA/CDA1 family)
VLKKSMVVILLMVLTFLSVSWFAPSLELGYKACLAVQLVKQNTFTFTHPLPVSTFRGNGSAATDGEGAVRIPVLMYHYIIPSKENKEPLNRSILHSENFEAGMKYLYDKGYYTATLQEFEDYVRGFATLPKRSVVLTFDDGYENNIVYAYPVMKKYGFKASLFVVGKNTQDKTGAFELSRRSYVSREQMKETLDVFEYHSHTFNLHHKTRQHCGKEISAAANAGSLKEDIRQMKAAGIDTPYLAYPYGETNYSAVYRLVKEGYRMAFTVKDGYVRPGDDPMYLRRITVTNETDFPKLFSEDNELD